MADKQEQAHRIAETRRIFRERFKILAALFPENGETLVARACAVACTLVNSPALHKAHVESIAERVIAAHHLGLEVGDQAYLVPYKGEAQLIVGPRGLITLAYRSGFVRSIYACSVFRADVEAGLFKYNLAAGTIAHEKAPAGRREGKPEELITHAYCIAQTSTGGTVLEVLTAEDIAYYRSFSKASSGPWFDNYEGMCRKTAIKRGTEFVPRSPLMSAALRENEAGGYEIPDEIWEQAKQKSLGTVTEQVAEEVVLSDTATGKIAVAKERVQQRVAPSESRERQPGEDG